MKRTYLHAFYRPSSHRDEPLTLLERHEAAVALRGQIHYLWNVYKGVRVTYMVYGVDNDYLYYLRVRISRLISAYRKLFI